MIAAASTSRSRSRPMPQLRRPRAQQKACRPGRAPYKAFSGSSAAGGVVGMFARNSAAWLLGAGFALLALLLVGSFVVSSVQRRDYAMVAHTLEVQKDIATVEGRLRDAESGQRGYIISGDVRFLEPFDRALASIDRDVDALARATMDNPRQQAALAELRPLIARRLAYLKRGRDLRQASSVVPTAGFLGLEQGRVAMERVRAKLAAMSREEDQLLARRIAQEESTTARLRLLLGAGFAVVVLLTLFAMRDTLRRLAEVSASRDALADANAQLVAEAESRERAETQLRQVQKMEAVGQLTGGIAHDFNNMLSIVIGSLELARRRLHGEPQRAEVCIDNAMEGAQRAAGLTARLLAFSRQQPLAPNPVDPNKLVGGMSELLRRTIGEQVRVETVLAGGIWRTNIDAQQLENAILNLCVNARDAMPDGGALTIETENAHLDNAYAAAHADVLAGQYVLVSVTDTGVGMPPEVIERAFDPFYTTKGGGRGTGLGLSQVFGFTKQTGGHVKIQSQV